MQYNSDQFESIKSFTIEYMTINDSQPYKLQKVGLPNFFNTTYQLYCREYEASAAKDKIQAAWLITQTFDVLEEVHILVTANKFFIRTQG